MGVANVALPNMYRTSGLTSYPEPVIGGWPAAYPPDYTHPRCREVVSRIAERGHRIVHMYPMGSSRAYSHGGLWAIASSCGVKYRGYPHPCAIDGRCGSVYNMNWCIGASHTGLLDAWWLWRDGQMVDLRALCWDGGRAVDGESAQAAQARHLEPIETLYDMCEVFAFASNLATLTATPYLVRISFGNMDGTTLHIHTQNWSPLCGDYTSRGDYIVLEPAVVKPRPARETYASIALEMTLDVLGHYDMDREASRHKLAREQSWFYGGQVLGAALWRWRGSLCSYAYP